MKKLAAVIVMAAAMVAAPMFGRAAAPAGAVEKTLDIYFIDVEGGQATLVVTPAGESLLIDAGYPDDSSLIAPAFGEKPGVPGQARDPQRVMAAIRDAGVKQIDYMVMTHSHADHGGGVLEVSELLPIKTFIDHIAPNADAETVVPGTRKIYERFLVARAKGKYIPAVPGGRVPLKGVDAIIIAANGVVLTKPLAGAGQPNPACRGTGVPAQEKTENPFSNALRLEYGKFRFLNVADLSGPPLFALTCPANLIGESDVYLVAHHGGNDGSDPALYAAVKPLVAITNNGPRKGAQAATLAVIKTMGIDGWQLHRTSNPGAENNPDDRLANLDETTSAWIKISAKDDGSFTVTNGRNGYFKTYKR